MAHCSANIVIDKFMDGWSSWMKVRHLCCLLITIRGGATNIKEAFSEDKGPDAGTVSEASGASEEAEPINYPENKLWHGRCLQQRAIEEGDEKIGFVGIFSRPNVKDDEESSIK